MQMWAGVPWGTKIGPTDADLVSAPPSLKMALQASDLSVKLPVRPVFRNQVGVASWALAAATKDTSKNFRDMVDLELCC